MRTEYQIEGNMLEDWFALLIIYFSAAVQMDQHMEDMENEEFNKKNDIPMTSNGKEVPPPYQYNNSALDQVDTMPEGKNAYSNVAYITPEPSRESVNL